MPSTGWRGAEPSQGKGTAQGKGCCCKAVAVLIEHARRPLPQPRSPLPVVLVIAGFVVAGDEVAVVIHLRDHAVADELDQHAA